jgi:hypothetical protein
MAIQTLNEYLAAPKKTVNYVKTASRTSVAAIPFSVFDLAGTPGAGTLAVGNTTAGIVPTDAIAGYPPIDSFGALKGYIGAFDFGSSVACRATLFDTLFSAGAFAFNAAATLTGQPSYAARIPENGGYVRTEIWIEAVTAFTGNLSVAVTYTNQDGVAGRTTGTVGTGAALIVGRMQQLPLQSGDSGVQSIQSITATVATAGTFNVHVLRRLKQCRVRINNDGDTHDFLKSRMPEVFETSALRTVISTDGTATGAPEIQFEIVLGS